MRLINRRLFSLIAVAALIAGIGFVIVLIMPMSSRVVTIESESFFAGTKPSTESTALGQEGKHSFLIADPESVSDVSQQMDVETAVFEGAEPSLPVSSIFDEHASASGSAIVTNSEADVAELNYSASTQSFNQGVFGSPQGTYPVEEASLYFIPKEERTPGNMGGPPPPVFFAPQSMFND